jgi:hypothetical protein
MLRFRSIGRCRREPHSCIQTTPPNLRASCQARPALGSGHDNCRVSAVFRGNKYILFSGQHIMATRVGEHQLLARNYRMDSINAFYSTYSAPPVTSGNVEPLPRRMDISHISASHQWEEAHHAWVERKRNENHINYHNLCWSSSPINAFL